MSLTTTSRTFRKVVIWVGIAAVAYYIYLLFLIPVGTAIYRIIFPEIDPATPLYGQLPPLEFEHKRIKNVEPPKYILDTTTGDLPKELPWKVPVYKLQKPVPSFEKGKDAIATAAAFGYYDQDLVSNLKDPVYEWKSITTKGVMRIVTDTKEVLLSASPIGREQYYPKGGVNEKRIKDGAIDFLYKIGRFNDELYANGWQRVILGRIMGTEILETDNVADAQLARVDFYRNIGDYRILGPDPNAGLINMTMRDPKIGYSVKRDVENNFTTFESHIWTVQTQSNAYYEISPVNEVWKLIQNNKGVIASIREEGGSIFKNYSPISIDEIFINDVYIAYYENTTFQEFLQPIYVFEGKFTTAGRGGGSIFLYYPAVTPEWIQKPEAN